MASKELTTKIILKGMTDPSLAKAFQNANNLSNNHINTLKKASDTAKKVAKIGTAAVGAGLVASAKSAIDYESAFAGVMKTVNETSTTTYADLDKTIRNMAKTMPATANEIAGVAEVAGQLGIKADDIAKFSKVIIDLGETTNISGEEGASAIAKYFNVTKTGMGDVDRFGATLVALGNNAATTENDIMNMSTRIASSGSMIGLSNQEILALATSLSSVGLEAEAGGTAISTVLSKIDKEVAMNGKTLDTWASLAGMSASDFKTAWQTDTMGTIQKVVGGMGNAKAGGKNLNLILDDLGITGIRTADTMKRLTNASGLMNDMVGLANKSWDENSALTNEANVRYNTMASKIQIFKNKITDAAITVGNKLMPIMDKVLKKLDSIDWEGVGEKIGNVIQWISDHSTLLLSIISAIAAAFVAFKVVTFIQGIIQAISIIKLLCSTFGTLNVIMSLNPIGLIIAGVAALIAIFVVLWNKCDGFRNFFITMWTGIKSIALSVGNWLKNFFTVTIPNAFNKTIEFFKSLPSKIWNFLVMVITKMIQFRLMIIRKAIEIGRNFLNAIVSFFKQLPYKIGYFIGFVIGKIVAFGQKLWNFATVTIPQFIGKVVNWFAKLPGRIWTWLVNTVQKVIAWGARMISLGKQKATQFINAVVNFIKTLPGKIWTWLTNTIQKITSWGTKMVSKGRKAATDFFNAIVNKIKELPGKMLSLGKNIVEGLWNGIKNAKKWLTDKVKSFASGITDGIKSALKIKSPSRVMEKLAKFIPQGLGNGIINNAKYAVNAVKKLGGKITSTATKINPTISAKATAIGEKVRAFGKGGTVTSPQQAIVGDKPETIVPHGNTPRNRGLLGEAVRGVFGKKSQKSGSVYNFTFAPVINGGNAAENKQMLESEFERFKQMMDEYIAEKGELAF